MRDCAAKRSSKRVVCILLALLIASAFSACKKKDAYSYISPGSAASETTAAVSETTTAETAAPAGDISVGWCNGDEVLIRNGPGTDYYGVGALYIGDKVTVLGKEGDWYEIKYAKGNNGVGYVNAQYISATEVEAKPSSAGAAATTAAAQ